MLLASLAAKHTEQRTASLVVLIIAAVLCLLLTFRNEIVLPDADLQRWRSNSFAKAKTQSFCLAGGCSPSLSSSITTPQDLSTAFPSIRTLAPVAAGAATPPPNANSPETLTPPCMGESACRSRPSAKESQKAQEDADENFPRWSGGVRIEDLIEALRVSLDHRLYVNRVHTVYIVKKDGPSLHRLYKATVKGRAKERSETRESRMEALAQAALSQRLDLLDDAYPFLKLALEQGGFPYMTNHGDSKFCLDPTPFTDEKEGGRIILNVSVPIFTNSAPLMCTKSFPQPNYRTITKASLENWTRLVQEYRLTYPWNGKKRQAVWRGSPTGRKNPKKNKRLRLVEHAGLRPDLIDAKFTETSENLDFNKTAYLGDWMPMEDFQNYRAILDVDGNSWSARFAEQLCYSSVTIKVQPQYVDYFYMELQPWVHYIPVSANMRDLYKHVEFAISDAYQEQVRQIILNANEWCRSKLRPEQLTKDLAHVWDVYAQQLFVASPNWSETWRREEAKLMREYDFKPVD